MGRWLTRLSAEMREISNLFCYWRSKINVDANLVLTGTCEATKLNTKGNHVKDSTAKFDRDFH